MSVRIPDTPAHLFSTEQLSDRPAYLYHAGARAALPGLESDFTQTPQPCPQTGNLGYVVMGLSVAQKSFTFPWSPPLSVDKN